MYFWHPRLCRIQKLEVLGGEFGAGDYAETGRMFGPDAPSDSKPLRPTALGPSVGSRADKKESARTGIGTQLAEAMAPTSEQSGTSETVSIGHYRAGMIHS